MSFSFAVRQAVKSLLVASGVDALMERSGVVFRRMDELVAQGQMDLIPCGRIVGAVTLLLDDGHMSTGTVVGENRLGFRNGIDGLQLLLRKPRLHPVALVDVEDVVSC